MKLHHRQTDKALFEESGEGKISQPMGELWWQLRPEHSFSIEFSWHAASNVCSPRTVRKIKVVLISSNMKKEEALPCHSIALLAYGKKERRISFDPTQEEPCLFLILNSKPMHKEKKTKVAIALSKRV